RNEAEDALNGSQLNDFLKNLLPSNKFNLRIAFVGAIVTRLYGINATRNLTKTENDMIGNLRMCLDTINLSPVYKQIVIKLLINEDPMLRINQNVDYKNLLIRLVIIHILAVHASFPDNYSPLTLYLHRLQDAIGTYVLTCQYDEVAMIMYALKELTWYQCICGHKYVVGECGTTMEVAKCPGNNRGYQIGGKNHITAMCQTRLSKDQVQKFTVNGDQTGYIMEAGTSERGKNVREMTAASYRILHLFIHALIANSAHSQIFLKNILDPIAYCLDHISKDWEVLKALFNCDDEDLALILHDMLHSITQDPIQNNTILTTPDGRLKWERQFTEQYINKRAKNPTATAMNLRNKLRMTEEENHYFLKEKKAFYVLNINIYRNLNVVKRL
ncbi:23661_t:CDS:2, partial [Racocetra persica]